MKPTVEVRLAEGPLHAAEPAVVDGAGAVLQFEGVVRSLEGDEQITALQYEAYEPMTTRELTRLAEAVVQEHGLLAMRVEHSVGEVPVAKVSFRLTIGSVHRAEGLAAASEFIDRMKRDAPLWKTAVR